MCPFKYRLFYLKRMGGALRAFFIFFGHVITGPRKV